MGTGGKGDSLKWSPQRLNLFQATFQINCRYLDRDYPQLKLVF